MSPATEPKVRRGVATNKIAWSTWVWVSGNEVHLSVAITTMGDRLFQPIMSCNYHIKLYNIMEDFHMKVKVFVYMLSISAGRYVRHTLYYMHYKRA